MFKANTELQVASTSFNEIKSSFKDFVKNKTEFLDYDFEGSTINQILNILAYDSYQKAIYTNMALNENFLDTGQIRSNVVSSAKKLGYFPRTAKSSVAELMVTFSPNDAPNSITVPKYTSFAGKRNNIEYTFLTLEDNVFLASNSYVKTISVYEGTKVTQRFIYNDNKEFYELFNDNIYDKSISVRVRSNVNTTDFTTYSLFEDITELDGESKVYWLEESFTETYHLSFGDGILGKKLTNGNEIEVTYFVCSADIPNGVNVFKNVGQTGHNTILNTTTYVPSSIITMAKAVNGSPKETIESIKFNAPKYYTTQNRLVTLEDYRSFLIRNYEFVQSIAVWGGEENEILVPGRVLVSIKPKNGFVISEAKKNEMIAAMKKRNVLSIEPIIIDPTFIYIKPTINVEYNSLTTSLSPETLFDKISNVVQDFELNDLSIFEKSFVFSRFSKKVDEADAAIIGNETTVLLEKRFTPILNSTHTYKLLFNKELTHPYEGYLGTLSSSGFKINTNANVVYFDDDGLGKVRVYYLAGQTKVYINNDVGTIDYSTGTILINSLNFTETVEGSEIKIFVDPDGNNYIPIRNQIVLLSDPKLELFDISIKQIVRSDFIDVNGNVSPIASNSTNVPITL